MTHTGPRRGLDEYIRVAQTQILWVCSVTLGTTSFAFRVDHRHRHRALNDHAHVDSFKTSGLIIPHDGSAEKTAPKQRRRSF
jgi:hypothetical protein